MPSSASFNHQLDWMMSKEKVVNIQNWSFDAMLHFGNILRKSWSPAPAAGRGGRGGGVEGNTNANRNTNMHRVFVFVFVYFLSVCVYL